MLYRFSICRKGLPPCRFGAAAGVAGGLHLGDFRAVQFGFSLLRRLVGCKLELQLRKLDT